MILYHFDLILVWCWSNIVLIWFELRWFVFVCFDSFRFVVFLCFDCFIRVYVWFAFMLIWSDLILIVIWILELVYCDFRWFCLIWFGLTWVWRGLFSFDLTWRLSVFEFNTGSIWVDSRWFDGDLHWCWYCLIWLDFAVGLVFDFDFGFGFCADLVWFDLILFRCWVGLSCSDLIWCLCWCWVCVLFEFEFNFGIDVLWCWFCVELLWFDLMLILMLKLSLIFAFVVDSWFWFGLVWFALTLMLILSSMLSFGVGVVVHLIRLGLSWLVSTWFDLDRLGLAWLGLPWLDFGWLGLIPFWSWFRSWFWCWCWCLFDLMLTWFDLIWFDLIWFDLACSVLIASWYVLEWIGLIWCELIWFGFDWIDLISFLTPIRCDAIWTDLTWLAFDLTWLGLAWLGLIWCWWLFGLLVACIWFDLIWFDLC